MRLPLEGLVCVFIATGCATNKPPENAEYTTVTTSDTAVTTDTREASESVPVSPEDRSGDTVDSDAAPKRRPVETTAPATIGGDQSNTTRTADAPRSETHPAPDATRPDNTKINERDTNSGAQTPLDQGENSADLNITQRIRKAVMADGSLSFTAKNVKIITSNKKVTLRGPVKNAAERASIEAAARKIAGPTMVDNQIEIAP